MNVRQATKQAVVAMLIVGVLPQLCRAQVSYAEQDREQREKWEKRVSEAKRTSVFNTISDAADSPAANEVKDAVTGEVLETLSKGVKKAPGIGNMPFSDGAEAAGQAAGGDYDQAVKTGFKAIYSTAIAIEAGLFISASAPVWISVGVGIGVGYGAKTIMDYILNPPMPEPKFPPGVPVNVTGRWTGTLSIASLVVDGSPTQQGCDMTKQVKGKPSALTLNCQGSPTAGTATLTAKPIRGKGPGGGDSTARLSYRVAAGSFKATGPMQGGTVTLIGKFRGPAAGWSINGTWTWVGAFGENAARGSGTWSVAAPKVK